MAILILIPGDLDPTVFLNELFRTNKPEQQSNTFWFPIPENPGKIENHGRIQTRILKETYELKKQEKLKSKDETRSRKKFYEKDSIEHIHC